MNTSIPVRIYADFNGLVTGIVHPDRIGVALDTFGSLRDLSNAGIKLAVGLPLVAFDESNEAEDLEGHGTAQYDSRRARWIVEFDEEGVRYVPAHDRGLRSAEPFRCVHCQAPVEVAVWNTTSLAGLCCNTCGTSVLAAIAPPDDTP